MTTATTESTATTADTTSDSPTTETTDDRSTDTIMTISDSTTPTDSIAITNNATTLGTTTMATADFNTNTDNVMTTFVYTVTPDTAPTSRQSPLTNTNIATTMDPWSVTTLQTVFKIDSVLSISATITSDTNGVTKTGLDFTTKSAGDSATVFPTTRSSTDSPPCSDAYPDFSSSGGPTMDTASSSSSALETGDSLFKSASTVPETTTTPPTVSTMSASYISTNSFPIQGYVIDAAVSFSDPVTLPPDSTSSKDSTDYVTFGTNAFNQINSTALTADDGTSTRTPGTPTIPEITLNSNGAPSGDTPSTGSPPTSRAGDSSFTAGTDTTFPDVPTDTPINIPSPKVPPPDMPRSEEPLPDVPLEVPPPNMPPTDIPFPEDVPTPDIFPPDEAQPEVIFPDVPPSDEAFIYISPSNIPSPDAPVSATPVTDVPTEIYPPDEAPFDDVQSPAVETPNVLLPDIPVPDLPSEVPRPDEATPDVSPVDVLTPAAPSLDLTPSVVPSLYVPPPDVPNPDIPFPVLTSDIPPSAVPSPDVPSPNVPFPDIPSPDSPSPDVPLPDIAPELPSSRTPDTLIDVPSPGGTPPVASVESLLPSFEEEGVVAVPKTTLDRPDPTDNFAPVDFTFPFLDNPNSVEYGSDSGPLPVGDPRNIPDDSIDSGLDSASARLGSDERENGALEGPDSSALDSASLDSRKDFPKVVDDPGVNSSAAQMEEKSSAGDTTSGGPAGQQDTNDKDSKQENTAVQNLEKGIDYDTIGPILIQRIIMFTYIHIYSISLKNIV